MATGLSERSCPSSKLQSLTRLRNFFGNNPSNMTESSTLSTPSHYTDPKPIKHALDMPEQVRSTEIPPWIRPQVVWYYHWQWVLWVLRVQLRASIVLACSGTCHGCLIRFGSWELGGQVDVFSSLSCSWGHCWAVLVVCQGSSSCSGGGDIGECHCWVASTWKPGLKVSQQNIWL